VRDFFAGEDFLEVETPVRITTPAPEANIDAIPSDGWYLATSPELHMKRLLASGFERIFQISRCFRREERGRFHNSEFTILEWYRRGGDYLSMLDDAERLLTHLGNALGYKNIIEYRGVKIDIKRPWPRIRVKQAFLDFAGWDPGPAPDPCRFDIDLVEKVEPQLNRNRPVVLMDYPRTMASLARLKSGGDVAERLEVYIGGLELMNAYSELTDAEEQRRRFIEENKKRASGGKDVYPLPEKFLSELRGMSPAGGCALGIDRLIMLLCDADSIDDVVPFTTDEA
jgi:lysyl-tRNA synthetase class 2